MACSIFCGFIAQLRWLERRTCITRSWVWTLMKPWIFQAYKHFLKLLLTAMIKGNLLNILHISFIYKPTISSNFAVNYFRPVGDKGPWRPMKLINSRPIFIAMWLTIVHNKDYKFGFSAKKKISVRTKDFQKNNHKCKKHLNIWGKMGKIQNYMFWYIEWKYPFFEIST